jgi:hypothetical protein
LSRKSWTLTLLALTPKGEASMAVTPQSGESLDDLLTQGRALAAQKRWADAMPFFQRATDRDPASGKAADLGQLFPFPWQILDRARMDDEYARPGRS